MKKTINWIDWAKTQIENYYECPLCNFRDEFESDVESHIEKKHTVEEIKEICSE